MRFLTFLLAALIVASPFAGVMLAIGQDPLPARNGVVFVAAGVVLAWAAEHAAALLARVAGRRPGGIGRTICTVASGLLPVATLLIVQREVLHLIGRATGPVLLFDLFAFGVACGPWMAFAAMTRLEPRTLIAMRGYVGGLSFLLQLAAWTAWGPWASLIVGGATAIPPVIVGSVAALAIGGPFTALFPTRSVRRPLVGQPPAR